MTDNICPTCGNLILAGRQYAYGDPCHYDGVSEWYCPVCETRIGRWTGRILTEGQAEPPFGRGLEPRAENA